MQAGNSGLKVKPKLSISKEGLAIMDLFSDSWTEKDIPDLSGKVVLVTGSTDGLGLAASKQFLMHNAHVIITYRDTGKLDG